MNHIYKFLQYIREDNGDFNLTPDTEISDDTNTKEYLDLKEEIISMIKTSIKSEDDKVFNDFIESIKKDPESSQIEGLINDSDVYDFYLKWRNDIDDILSDMDFYDEIPSDIKVFSLYEYIIVGTHKAIIEVIDKV